MNNDSYHEFLQSLDNSQLVDYVVKITQERSVQSADCSIQSSDPFDDGLDEVLANIEEKVPITDYIPQILLQSIPLEHSCGPVVAEIQGTKNDLVTPQINNNDQDEIKHVKQNMACPGSSPLNSDVSDGNILSENEIEPEREVDLESRSGIDLKQHGFGDYATYFHNKKLKQQQSDESYIQWELQRKQNGFKPIFENCAIFVNGHTIPPINEIHRLVILYGGQFVAYLSNKSSATHIICDRLTPKKNIEFKNCRVVKAQWITDSIKSNYLLPWTDYRLISDVEYGQKRLDLPIKTSRQVEVDDKLLEINPDISNVENDHMDHKEISLLSQEEDDEIEQDLIDPNTKIVLDAKHPDFLKHFFAKSRLHHLSTWKADLRLNTLRRILKASKAQATERNFNDHERLVLHIDFDCFFVAASCLSHPHLDINRDPIVVTHGGKTSDIASCNYVTRKFGIRNGMWVGQAEKLCKNIIKIDYDFDAYEKHSNEFYNYILSNERFDAVFPVLIDEVLIDASSMFNDSDNKAEFVETLSSRIRKDIFNLTGCTVSIGASHNVLLAKLANRKVKPDGQYYLSKDVDDFLAEVPIKNLPGIGRSIEVKLLEITSFSDSKLLVKHILSFSKNRLMSLIGEKTGTKLFNYCRGIDDTKIGIDLTNAESILGRKSVSVDVNFGIRFNTMDQLDDFLMRLAKELYSRLVKLGISGSSLTLKLAKRAASAPIVPPKHLGMGYCDFVSKSSRLGVPTNDWGIIGSEIKAIYRMLNIPVNELRGIAISMTKLEDVEVQKKNRQMRLPFNLLDTTNTIENKHNLRNLPDDTGQGIRNKNDCNIKSKELSNSKRDYASGGLDIEQIDWSVFELLPDSIKIEIKSELHRRGMVDRSANTYSKKYGGKTSLQYLLPSQEGSSPKVIRVCESPSKSKKYINTKSVGRSKSPLPSVLPIKKNHGAYEYSDSYNLSIVNELPSSIRNEVLREVQYKEKIKKFDLETFRDKIARKKLKQSTRIEKITSLWISNQTKYNTTPSFLGQSCGIEKMKELLEDWISSSLTQMGPHEDDIHVFIDYLQSLVECGQETRKVVLINHIKKCISYYQSINYTNLTNPKFIDEGINNWWYYITNKLDISTEH